MQSPVPGADGSLPGKKGDFGGSPSLAAPQLAAGTVREVRSSSSAKGTSIPSQARRRLGQRRMK